MYRIFLVGGAIRDKLLKLLIKEKDWIILNTNYITMMQLGFKIVGKDFPVFLHPITKEEYALARKEKKINNGYTGFKCYFFSKINLKEDLFRRDLTINTLILNKNGNIINYFHAIEDIKNKKIKHVSTAFSEDPLRILRIARFFTKYKNNGFLLSATTKKIIKNIKKTDITKLNEDRIIKEIKKTIILKNFYIFFYILKICKKIKYLFKNIDKLIIISTKFKFNKQLNCWNKIIKIAMLIKKFSNNAYLKLVIIDHISTIYIKISHTPQYCFSNQSKKYNNLLLITSKINIIYRKIIHNICKCEIVDIITQMHLKKNKIHILTAILINELYMQKFIYTYFFFIKYLILDILNIQKITSFHTKNRHNNIKIHKIKKIKKFYQKFYFKIFL